eukprot:352725-Chlamydomonas_euryale.AAC.1
MPSSLKKCQPHCHRPFNTGIPFVNPLPGTVTDSDIAIGLSHSLVAQANQRARETWCLAAKNIPSLIAALPHQLIATHKDHAQTNGCCDSNRCVVSLGP